MATKGSAGKSASGASMSKYDVEVESRLQALEAAVASLQAHSHEAPCDTGVGGDVEAAVRALVKPGSLNPTADELDQ
jgi:hypothetical protein